jgi:protein SCO1/2
VPRAVLGFVAILLIACAPEQSAPKPLSEPGEKLYDLRGRIVSRDVADNTLRVDHQAIPGFMEAMTMDFSVRGAQVQSLPPDQTTIEARVHVTDNGYWLTDVKQVP